MLKHMVSMVINRQTLRIGYTYKNTHSSPASHSIIQNSHSMIQNLVPNECYVIVSLPEGPICKEYKFHTNEFNENNSNETKLVEKLKFCTYKITYISAAIHHSLPNLVLNQCKGNAIVPKWSDMQIT